MAQLSPSPSPDRAAVAQHIEAALRFPELSPRDTVRRALSPRIAVVSSSDVDDICQRGRLNSFADLLLPFGDQVEGKVTARDSAGLPHSLDNFTVRFTSLADLEEPDASKVGWVTLNAARRKVRPASAEQTLPLIRGAGDVTPAYRGVPLEGLTPWYRDFRNLYLEYSGAMDHDSFNHPVACVIAVSSLQENAVEELAQLYESQSPALFDKGFADPKVLKFFVLVHDCQLADFAKYVAGII
ncbi:hypothetical protein THASP1DRAFT_32816 [Thamnocephalis sphaerospora]|uniref:Uncharacterized protein n=1 Tax=Thamnocephalis sphaerospora TaxID=78915 RepID=A0A4P9XI05_9FUNG|nr:hypothetical protein THASP1DRAFT_32816 [Thamnocephalis sphaerospora]|eukprot:RKP05344.1 hypothetical protein THASP1DRAFT_32816 [Thamnocephalis sphaerospora]